MNSLFGGIYSGRKVLVTGHTGFKGSWLCHWLHSMGAEVVGYSLPEPTNPSHFALLAPKFRSEIGDIRDQSRLDEVFASFQPEIVFHLAAQPIVRLSYEDPIQTFDTNVIGTLKVFEACRKHGVKAIVNVTSDKCYDNREWVWGYRESDPMGGHDPYSASKGCAELVANSYRSSFFPLQAFGKTHNTLLASCRAGNVIGGGDWAACRLLTDVMKNAAAGLVVSLRNPKATRPWQHVLEPLSGYLLTGMHLLQGDTNAAQGWNFGPSDEGNFCVEDVVRSVQKHWAKVKFKVEIDPNQPHEANLLKLDCSKAKAQLNWNAVWTSAETFAVTTDWYRQYYEQGAIMTDQHLSKFVADAHARGHQWAS